MTRRVFLSSALCLSSASIALAKPPAKKAVPSKTVVVKKPAVPTAYTVVDLCPVEDAERVVLSEAGSVLLTRETVGDTPPTRLWTKGKLVLYPQNFIGLGYGIAPGSLLGYTREEDGITRAAVYKAGMPRLLLPVEDGDNTKAILQSKSGTVVLILSSGDSALLVGGNPPTANELGRAAAVGDAPTDPFLPVGISGNGNVIAGNQSDRGYAWDEGDWNMVRVEPDAERTMVSGIDILGRTVCGFVISGFPPVRRAFLYVLTAEPGDEVAPFLPLLPVRDGAPFTDSAALAMSADGSAVVGYVSLGSGETMKKQGVLWVGNRAYDLTARLAPDSKEWQIIEPQAINLAKQIVAVAENKSGRRIVLLNAVY